MVTFPRAVWSKARWVGPVVVTVAAIVAVPIVQELQVEAAKARRAHQFAGLRLAATGWSGTDGNWRPAWYAGDWVGDVDPPAPGHLPAADDEATGPPQQSRPAQNAADPRPRSDSGRWGVDLGSWLGEDPINTVRPIGRPGSTALAPGLAALPAGPVIVPPAPWLRPTAPYWLAAAPRPARVLAPPLLERRSLDLVDIKPSAVLQAD